MTVTAQRKGGLRSIWTTVLAMLNLKWIKGLGNITGNQKVNFSMETRQENSLQVEPLINVFLS